MSRCFSKIALPAASAVLLAVLLTVPVQAMTLHWPKPDQIVRENVKISIPGSEVPENSFISVLVGEPGQENFVLAVNSETARSDNGTVNIFWNSKAPYRTISDPKTDRFFKDGKYSIKVEVHQQGASQAKIVGVQAINVVLKNKIARTNPAPGVSLANRLSFGQLNTYGVQANVQVFQVVSGVGLPIVGGLGMSCDFKLVQSVEDVRGNGQYLLRYRMGENPKVVSFGQTTTLYQGDVLKPQLYRLINKYGDVIKANMFSKQAKFAMTDVLPVLPKNAVKEGDTWPDSMSLKLEGLTGMIDLKGTCALDSFEWQNGHECVKLISQMAGKSSISLDNGRIKSTGNVVKAEVVTYFAYKAGKAVRREIILDFPAVVQPGAGDLSMSGGIAPGVPNPGSPAGYSASPFGSTEDTSNADSGDEEGSTSARRGSRRGSMPGMPGMPGVSDSASNENSNIKKGTVQIRATIQLEK